MEDLEKAMRIRAPLTWGFRIGRYVDYTIDTMAVFDDGKAFGQWFSGLKVSDTEGPRHHTTPTYPHFRVQDTRFLGDRGQAHLSPLFRVKNAILNFQENLSLEDAQVYQKPQNSNSRM